MADILGVEISWFIYGLIGIVIVLAIWLFYLHRKIARLTRGKSGESLEESIMGIGRDINKMFEYKENIDDYLSQVEDRLKKSVSSVETVRFNPFRDTGGNQSFSTAFINEKGDGVVISGIYSREKMNIYSKPVINYSSEHELLDEEREVIKRAQQ